MISSKQINIFLAFTEYHLITSINLALSLYNSDGYDNQIYYRKGANRLNYEIKPVEGLQGFIKPLDSSDWIGKVEMLSKFKCDRFFFFQENSILNKYLAYRLKKKGATICLGPDGSKPYGEFQKEHEWLSMIKDTFTDYKYLLNNKLFLPAIIPSRYYRYGSTRIIDEVWVQFPELYDAVHNKTAGKVMTLPEFDSEVLSGIVKAFQFNSEPTIQNEQVLLYINQPFWSEELIRVEFDILNQIQDKYPAKNIYIKLHPNTPEKTIEKYKGLTNVVLLHDNHPAELYLSVISKSIVFSGWSAALMHYNPSNTYYYLLPFYIQCGDKILNQIKMKPFSHIQSISSVDQLQFP